MQPIGLIILLLAYLSICLTQVEAYVNHQRGTLKELANALSENIKDEDGKFSIKNLLDEFVLDVVPTIEGQKPSNIDGKFEQYRDRLMNDSSNDEIVRSNVEHIVKRSGYGCEKYTVIAEDNYRTTLYRIVNPLADKRKLKWPPVMLMHGGLINSAAYVITSAIQHHPEKYPRTAADGPITSWNRSIAFTLANDGFDVWLVGTRGSDRESQGRVPQHDLTKLFKKDTNMTTAEKYLKLTSSLMYWRYSFDDIIAFEVPHQIDKVLQVTGSKKLMLFSYSYGTTVALSTMAFRPDIAKEKIHSFIVMAPMINLDSSSILTRRLCGIIRHMPIEYGNLIFTRRLELDISHRVLPTLGKMKKFRYSAIKLFLNLVLGSSGKYRTFLEPSLLGHLTQPLAFKQLKHACQHVKAKQYQKYDYGFLFNKWLYGTFHPPAYNISDIHIKDWILITAEFDNYGCQSSIKQILEQVNPKPLKHIMVPGYNHIDLLAGVDVENKVTKPVLEFANRFAVIPRI